MIKRLIEDIKSGKTSAEQEVKKALDKAEKYADYHCFTSLNTEEALKKAREVDQKIKNGETVGKLAGLPYALKDNMLSYDGATTASSRMLEDFHSPIVATAVKRLEDEGAIMIGRTNLDSFAHGSSTENSYFGPTKNAHDKTRVPGGSSGGSAAAVALDIVPFAFGTDTGGSIRQPAAYNGIFGYKPTFGTVSRYGVIAMASSTDVVGTLTQNIADSRLLTSIISGPDRNDPTTITAMDWEQKPDKPRKIGVIKDFLTDSLDPAVLKTIQDYIAKLKTAGHNIEEVEMPMIKYGLAVYYIVTPAEIASNLSRYDGVRYGFRSEQSATLQDLYGHTRDEGFMIENKRRVMIGNFVLSSGFFDAYYLKAEKVRTLIIDEYNKAFEKYDFLLAPITATPAFKLGENIDDPIKMYLEDMMSVVPSLAGLPAIAVPAGKTDGGLPIGLQFVGPRRSDPDLLDFVEGVSDVR